MLYYYDESTRRTLQFPVVKPSDSISFSTLVNSLISICTKICTYKSSDCVFTSNKHNANTAIRFVGVLQIILEEIKDGCFEGISVISPFSDLHVALQEIAFLLADLTRRDARVWLLINAEFVAGRFRAVFGSAGDVLGRLSAEVGGEFDDEVRECVVFLTRQVDRAGFEVETGDVLASRAVMSVLGRMERRVIPDPVELRRVMDYLGIKTWFECNDQVKLLEEENRLNGLGLDSLVSLLGLMIYCRCVLFDHSDGEKLNFTRREVNKQEYVIGGCLNPDDFKCPISLEIMVDPVTISTGHTYDRSSILKWFKSGNPVCPKTGQRLQTVDLVPNIALKHLIKQHCLENDITLPCPKAMCTTKNGANIVGNSAAEGAVKMVADFLSIKLAMGTISEKCKATIEIRLLTKRSAFIRACFVESGVIPYLLSLILAKDSTTQENSMAALLNLSKLPEVKSAIVDNGGLGLVVRVLRNGIKIEARQHAAATMFYLSSVEDYRRLIGNNSDAIPSLVELIRVGGDRSIKNALVAIFGLLMLPSNHFRVLESRLVPLLVNRLGSLESEDLIVDTLAVLSALAEKHDGAKAIMRAKGLDAIVRVLCLSSSDSSRFRREHCVSLLHSLCINCGREVLEVLVKNTSLMGALYSLLIEGTSRATKKASSLITILHEFTERSSTRSMPHALPHENFIHVW